MSPERRGLALVNFQRRVGRVLSRQLHSAYGKLRHKSPVHLLHIGKTGGSAVKHTLRSLRGLTPYNILDRPHNFKLEHVPEGEKAIFFLRDPAKRFVSGFYSRQRKGGSRYLCEWSPAEAEAFTQFSTPDELARALSSTDPATKHAAEKAMRSIMHINMTFSYWLGSEAYLATRLDDIFYIGFQESLSDDFSKLLAKLNINYSRGLPENDALAHVSPKTLDKNLSNEALRNLQTWYREDYALLDMCLRLKPTINDMN